MPEILEGVSLITTVYNEEQNHLEGFLDKIIQGSHIANEFIVVDAGSTDRTVELLEKYKNKFPILNMKIVVEGGANIARGRNLAIKLARESIIAITDAGCEVDRNWLYEITKPIVDGTTSHVAGWYEGLIRNSFQKKMEPFLFPELSEVLKKKNGFLPSSRSIAFTIGVFDRVGGYPEWMTFAGEDTYFDKKIVETFGPFYFNERAFVYWEPVANINELKKKYFMYGLGEGEARLYRFKSMLRFFSILFPIDLLLYPKKRKCFKELFTIRLYVSLGYFKGVSSGRKVLP